MIKRKGTINFFNKNQTKNAKELCSNLEKVMKLSSLTNDNNIDSRITEVDTIIPGTFKKIFEEVYSNNSERNKSEINFENKMLLSDISMDWIKKNLDTCKKYMDNVKSMNK